MELLHVLSAEAWATAMSAGAHAPAELLRDGFLHCCTEAQLDFVLARHFVGRDGLVVVAFESAVAPGEVRWVSSEPDQAPFPHFYGAIPVGAVIREKAL